MAAAKRSTSSASTTSHPRNPKLAANQPLRVRKHDASKASGQITTKGGGCTTLAHSSRDRSPLPAEQTSDTSMGIERKRPRNAARLRPADRQNRRGRRHG